MGGARLAFVESTHQLKDCKILQRGLGSSEQKIDGGDDRIPIGCEISCDGPEAVNTKVLARGSTTSALIACAMIVPLTRWVAIAIGIRLKDRPSSAEVVVQLDRLAVGSMPIRVRPSSFTRQQRDFVTEALFYDQPLERREPTMIVTRTVIRLAAVRIGLDLVRKRSGPFSPGEVPFSGQANCQRERPRLPRFGEHGPVHINRAAGQPLAVHGSWSGARQIQGNPPTYRRIRRRVRLPPPPRARAR
jgi:hypothetical protein